MATAGAGRDWGIVLASGEGSRLQSLTTDASGRAVPKQFCSLRGGRSLLADALARAGSFLHPGRVLTVVAEAHRSFWEPELTGEPRANVVVQAANRGTAAGVLLPLLHVLERDPAACVAILPSDHHVADEAVLASSFRCALALARKRASGVILLGMRAQSPETQYGWMLCGADRSRMPLRRLERFVEKPPLELAVELKRQGGLWNAFLIAARAKALLGLFRRRTPTLCEALEAAMRPGDPARRLALEAAYRRIPVQDFSRDVLQGSEPHLRVLEVPPCGWTDLGTPERVARCLSQVHAVPRRASGSLPAVVLAMHCGG